MKLSDRLVHGWNAFMNKDPTRYMGPSYATNPSRPRFTRGNEKSIVNSVYNRIAMDCAAIDVVHCKIDENKNYIEDINSTMNECLKVEANIDQTGRAFMQDIVMSMLDEGVVAVVPVDTNLYSETGAFDIESWRTGKIVEWFPDSVRVQVYNDKTGKKEEVIISKRVVAIIENPFYSVTNEPNSTMQRLIRKISLSDVLDEKTGSNQLDIIIQLPYQIKTDIKRQQAEQRVKDIEMQLSTSKYGIAYADAAEHITQLNRPIENHLMDSIEYLTNLLYSQLGITVEIMNGTADEAVMNNYYSRTVEPILSAICDEMRRKFLTKTARSQHQSIEFFRDPFKLIPASQLAEMADKLGRNEIVTSNEFRQKIGMKPASDPRADELRNKNLSEGKDEQHINIDGENITDGYANAGNNPDGGNGLEIE